MKQSFDAWLREELNSSKYEIPESYERKISETLEQLKDREVSHRSGRISWLAAHKVAGVAIVVFLLSVVSVSSYAAVNMFQDRMSKMPEKVRENYNNDVQNSNVEADAYSRKLTEGEEEKIINLREQYEKEGKFPQREIAQVRNSEDIVKDELYFVTEESKFYLPERTLTEEEMLEMIDLQEKRDYSVRQQNITGDRSGEAVSQPNAELEKQSAAIVAKLYNLTEKDLEIVSTAIIDHCHEVVIKAADTQFSVYYSKENVLEQVVCKKDHLSAHRSDVKMESLKTRAISEKMKKRVEVFTGKEVGAQSGYSVISDNGTLVSGTVSYYYQMSDGSGCVAVYSTSYQDLYHIYTLDDNAAIREEIQERESKAKEKGYTYQLICRQ